MPLSNCLGPEIGMIQTSRVVACLVYSVQAVMSLIHLIGHFAIGQTNLPTGDETEVDTGPVCRLNHSLHEPEIFRLIATLITVTQSPPIPHSPMV